MSLQQDVEAAVRGAGLVGATIAVWADGHLQQAHVGTANIDTGVPVTALTVHQIGSISKVFTATLVMQLVEQGRLALDDVVADVLPDLRLDRVSVPRTITVRHLLTHTSGLELGDWQGENLALTGRGDDCLRKYIAFCADHLLLKPPAPVFPATDAHYRYSNIGYVLLGCIAERRAGMTWDELLTRCIFAPLGLTHATSLPEQAVRWPNAIGHVINAAGGDPRTVPDPYLARAMGPAVGRIKMTAADLIGFARTFLGTGDSAILSRATMTRMIESSATVENDRGQGLGWMLYDWAGVPVFGHDGGVPGAIATLRIVPDRDLIVVGFFNGGNAVAFAADFFPRFFKSFAGLAYPPVPPGAIAHFKTYMMQGNYDFPGKDVDVIDGKRVPRVRVRHD